MLKGVTKTIKNGISALKVLFLSMLLGTLRAILSGNMLAGKGIVRTSYGNKKSTTNCKSRLWIKKNSDSTSSFNKFWNLKILSKWS